MTILSIDLGTTHAKVGLYQQDGCCLQLASRCMKTHHAPDGWDYFDPQEVKSTITGLIQEVMAGQPEPVEAVGVASMAETGILLDRKTGKLCSPLIPWFETASQVSADRILESTDAGECYQKFGLKATFKVSLAKVLWLRDTQNIALEEKVWLSTADYVVYWLTGKIQTDFSLASRTFAFRVDRKEWDREWLERWQLPVDLFPPVQASGAIAGEVNNPACGLPRGTPVSICGHDHVCAALAMGAIRPGCVFNSMGTAEALIGALPERQPTPADEANGLLYGCHTAPGMGYWMGGISASGGSVEWLRSILGLTASHYTDLEALLSGVGTEPSGILYLPYLLGSGSPHTDPSIRAAFIGLSAHHTPGDLLKAVFEGTAYELELIRQAGERMSGEKITSLTAAGGGTRLTAWMQIKADVTGCTIRAAAEPEATLSGAALLAGVGKGIYSSVERALAVIAPNQSMQVVLPDAGRHARYQDLFTNGYLAIQESLRKFAHR